MSNWERPITDCDIDTSCVFLSQPELSTLYLCVTFPTSFKCDTFIRGAFLDKEDSCGRSHLVVCILFFL